MMQDAIKSTLFCVFFEYNMFHESKFSYSVLFISLHIVFGGPAVLFLFHILPFIAIYTKKKCVFRCWCQWVRLAAVVGVLAPAAHRS